MKDIISPVTFRAASAAISPSLELKNIKLGVHTANNTAVIRQVAVLDSGFTLSACIMPIIIGAISKTFADGELIKGASISPVTTRPATILGNVVPVIINILYAILFANPVLDIAILSTIPPKVSQGMAEPQGENMMDGFPIPAIIKNIQSIIATNASGKISKTQANTPHKVNAKNNHML